MAEEEKKTTPTEAEALMEVAQAIRELPTANVSAQRQARFQPKGSISGLMGTLADLNDPKIQRELQRERAEDERAKRAARHANVALVIAALSAVGSILALVLR